MSALHCCVVHEQNKNGAKLSLASFVVWMDEKIKVTNTILDIIYFNGRYTYVYIDIDKYNTHNTHHENKCNLRTYVIVACAQSVCSW